MRTKYKYLLSLLLLCFLGAQGKGYGQELLWKYSTGSSTKSSPSIGNDGTVYIGSMNSKIFAIDNNNGSINWTASVGGGNEKTISVGNYNTLYFWSYNKVFYAFDGQAKKTKWEFKTGDYPESLYSAVSSNGVVYVAGTKDKTIYALDAEDGSEIWSFNVNGYIESAPTIGVNGNIYIAANDLYYLDGFSGEKIWKFPIGKRCESAPAYDANGVIYIGSTNGRLYSIDVDGNKIWDFKAAGDIYSSPTISLDGNVYIGSNDNNVYSINSKNGVKKWEFKTNGIIESSPAIGGDGSIYFGSHDGKVYALDKNGVLKWNYNTGSPIASSPSIGNDGVLYITAQNGTLYAFSTANTAPADSPWPMFGQNAQHTGSAPVGAISIQSQPQNTVAEKGNRLSLFIYSKGAFPRTYQWQRNGVDIPGATQPSLTIENATSKDSGLYRVTITNKHGSVTSDEAVLKVVSPGAPKIFADGKEVVGSVVKGDKAEITLSTSFEGGSIFYTFDGSEPSFESALYDGPFTVSKTTGIRAVAYKKDFSDLAEADPVLINIVPNYDLKISVQGQGTVIKDPVDGPYMQDSVVKLKAMPEEGWRFVGWSGALMSSFEEGSVVMGGNNSLEAMFERIEKHTITNIINGGGEVLGFNRKQYVLDHRLKFVLSIEDFTAINGANNESFINIERYRTSGWVFPTSIFFKHQIKDDPSQSVYYYSAEADEVSIDLKSAIEFDDSKVLTDLSKIHLDIGPDNSLTFSDGILKSITLKLNQYIWTWKPDILNDYLDGLTLNLKSKPSDGWLFLGWKGDADGTDQNLALTVNRDKTVEAVFGTDLTTKATGNGKLILDPPNGPYPYGTKLKITPVPDAGYYLGIWGGDALGMPKGPIEYEITKANPEITALFVPLKENRFTVTTLATAGGSVVSNPNSNAYVNGQQITLTATPEPGYSFVGWTGDIESTVNPLVTLADANKTVTAQFRRNIIAPVTLTINAENGTVTRTPADELYEKGTSVELFAQPNPGYTFTGWADALGGTANRTTLFLDGDKTVTANFKASYQLAAETRGPGSVLTTPSSTKFIDGDQVILTASPAEGYGFVGWTGDLESTDQQTTLAMDSNKRVIAHFAQLGTLTTWTRGEGTITRTPDKQSYFPGAKVTLTATPGDGFQFVSWDGQASGTSNPTTVTMDRAMSVAANFKDIKAPTVTIAYPAAQETGDETFTLSGTVTDNGKIKSLVWLWKGQEMGELELVDGKFELPDQKLAGGANAITVVATDRSGNEGKATVNPTWVADRSIRIAAAKEQQEGNRVEVPIEISSKGNVGGMGFVLNYDHSYLMDPVLTWSSAAGGSINLVNSEVAGELKGTFSLGGTSLPGGDQLIGTVSFRARSVPGSLETVLGLQDLSISDSNGNKLTSGTDVVSGRARVLVRDITGDNNANDRLDVGDATRIQRLLVGLDRARAWDVSSNDLNGSGDLDPGDVVKVLRAVVGIDPQPKRNRVIAKMGGDDEAIETAMLLIKEKTASTVTVQVQLKDMASTIAGANFQLEYPAELLRLKDKSSHAPGEIVAGNAAAIWNVSPAQTDYAKQDGTLAMAVSSPEPWTVKEGVLAEVSFEVQNGADMNQAVLALSQVEVTPDGFDNRMLSGSSFNVGSGETDKPTEPSEVEIIGIENAPFGFSFNTEEGTRYEVQASDDLRKWEQLREVKGTGEAVKFVDFRKAFYQQQYYRVKIMN